MYRQVADIQSNVEELEQAIKDRIKMKNAIAHLSDQNRKKPQLRNQAYQTA
jgi:hypothetical protein